MDGAQSGPSLIKQLASCDEATRNHALSTILGTWLPNQSRVSDDDMKKLWKGLFYCVWHADKLPAQTELVDHLSAAVHTLDLPLSLRYFSVFLLTMRREWTSIDGLRLDKFYLLIRRFLHCFFLLLKKNSWDLELTRRLMSLLVEGTFLTDDKFQGNGVKYHIASIFVEELRPFLPIRKVVIEVLLYPFISLMGKIDDKILVGKIKSNVFDTLMKMGKSLLEIKKSGVEIGSCDDVLVLGPIALTMGFSTRFYELGSSPDCCQGNRKAVFGLHEGFMKLEKELTSSCVEISMPEVKVDDDDDEVPSLVLISKLAPSTLSEQAEDVANGCYKKALKKRSKPKKASSGIDKKDKKNKNAKSDLKTGGDTRMDKDNDSVVTPTSENVNDHPSNEGNPIKLNESVISNLQVKFEKVAAAVGLDSNIASICDLPMTALNGSTSKKRKRAKNLDKHRSQNPEATSGGDAEASTMTNGSEKSAKRVKFSMKNNLVWKPHSPLPPQSLRLPPSVTPRGSALKKGIPPGPIREMPSPNRKVKQKTKSVKKARKGMKIISPAVKRLKKLKSHSP